MTASEQPPGDDTALLTAALSHSWTWYDEYAKRAIQVINFYIVATAIVVSAYANAINGKHYGFAVFLAIAGLALTAIGSVAGLAEMDAAYLAEPALDEMQERIAGRLGTDSIRIVRLQRSTRQRRAGVIIMFALTTLATLAALGYAAANL
jgi:aryl carrier-like protein